jgi:hypothetical protein
MAWFNRNKSPKGETEAAHDSRVEVVVHKEAAKDAVQEAKAVNKHLNKLLEQNGFTIKIFLAAGGRIKNTEAKK